MGSINIQPIQQLVAVPPHNASLAAGAVAPDPDAVVNFDNIMQSIREENTGIASQVHGPARIPDASYASPGQASGPLAPEPALRVQAVLADTTLKTLMAAKIGGEASQAINKLISMG